MTREIEWVEFNDTEQKLVIAIGHELHVSSDQLWIRFEAVKDGYQIKSQYPISAETTRLYLNKWFPLTQSVKDPAPSPGTETPREPWK